MRKQHPQAFRPMLYEDNTWIASVVKPHGYKYSTNTLASKVSNKLAEKTYARNATETEYVWNVSNTNDPPRNYSGHK